MAHQKEQISPLQAGMLTVNLILPTAILFLPAISAAQAKEDAWLSPLVAIAVGFGLVYLYTKLAGYFPGTSLIEFLPRLLGWLPGKVVGALYLWWFLHAGATVVREFAEFMLIAVMPETPRMVFVLVLLLLCAYALRKGIEVVARANQVILVAMVGSLLLLLLLVSNKLRIDNLQPFLAGGLPPVLRGAYSPTSWLGETIITTVVVLPYLTDPRALRRSMIGGLLVTGLLIDLGAVVTLGTVGLHWVVTAKLPMLMTARVIEVGNFLERMEPLFIAIWISGSFVKVSLFYFAFCSGLAQWLGSREYRPLVLPSLTLFAPLSMLVVRNSAELGAFLNRVWPAYALVVYEVGLPVLLLLVAWVRRALGRLPPERAARQETPR